MFVALHEMRRLAGRFALLTGAVALLVLLLLFFQAVAGALTSGLTGGIKNNQADVIVYSDRARDNPSASFLGPAAVDAVAAVDGVAQAAGVAKATFTVNNQDLSVIGLDNESVGGPATVSAGSALTQSGQAIAANPALSASDLRLALGDSVTVSGVEISVVGVADGAAFDAVPTLYVSLEDLAEMTANDTGGQAPTLLSWVAVDVDADADPVAVATRITTDVNYDATVGPPPGAFGGGQPPRGAPDASRPVATPSDSATPQTPPSESSSETANTSDPNSQPSTSSATIASAPSTTRPNQPTASSSPTASSPQPTTAAAANGGPPPAAIPPPGIGNAPQLSGGVRALSREQAANALPGIDQITQSFNILYALLYIVVTIVTGVFFLILTVQKQQSLILMRALGASKADAVRPVLIEVLAVVGVGSAIGVVVAGGSLYALRDVFGATLNMVTTVVSVAFILILGVLASFAAVRRVLQIDPVLAARTGGE